MWNHKSWVRAQTLILQMRKLRPGRAKELPRIAEEVRGKPWLAVFVFPLCHTFLARCEHESTGLKFWWDITSLPRALNCLQTRQLPRVWQTPGKTWCQWSLCGGWGMREILWDGSLRVSLRIVPFPCVPPASKGTLEF